MIELITYPAKVLSLISDNVIDFDVNLQQLIKQMFERMYFDHGVGLAAPQVGVLQRVIVLDPSDGKDDSQRLSMVNPILKFKSPDVSLGDEGCLSLPGIVLPVIRSNSIFVMYYDEYGQVYERNFNSLNARIIQHELDHLNGMMILDRVNHVLRRKIMKGMK